MVRRLQLRQRAAKIACVSSHPRTGDATAKKIAETNSEKFNELNFLRQNYGHCRNRRHV